MEQVGGFTAEILVQGGTVCSGCTQIVGFHAAWKFTCPQTVYHHTLCMGGAHR